MIRTESWFETIMTDRKTLESVVDAYEDEIATILDAIEDRTELPREFSTYLLPQPSPEHPQR